MRRFALVPILLLLASCVRNPSMPAPPYDAGLRDGSVIFWRGGLLVRPIIKHTDSDITHAAIVLYQGKEPWVYEAVPPRVHKVPMGEYRRLMEGKVHESRQPLTWFIIQPRVSYGTLELNAMKRHAVMGRVKPAT